MTKAMRVTSVLAGLIVTGVAALGPGSAARAEEDGSGAVGFRDKRVATSEVPAGSTTRRTESDGSRRPPNAVPTTRTSYPVGPSGPAFQEPGASSAIVGGTLANAINHPFIVGIRSIYWEDDGSGGLDPYEATCTGTILSPTKILTAAHCTVDLPVGSTYVFAGRNDLDDDSGGYVARVASTWTHPLFGYYSDVPRYDISVLTLKAALPNDYTSIGLIPQGDTSGEADMTSTQILGYGITAQGADNAGLLRIATVPVRADSTCTSSLGTKFDTATTLCAGAPNVDTCGGDSGGPLLMDDGGTPVQVGVTSWGPVACGSTYGAYVQMSSFASTINADKARAAPNNLDWTGDGHSDLIGRTPAGNLLLYYGTGLLRQPTWPAFGATVTQIGQGWAGFTKLFRVKNWNGDGTESIFASDRNGDLFQYRSDGDGNFVTGTAERIGNGWNSFNDIMVTSNWIGNGRPNLLGRAPNGDLYLYTSNGSGGWMNNGSGIKIGNGWNVFDTILTPGAWLGDGRPALIGRTPAGQLRLYQGNGQGGWVNGSGTQIGNGWNVFVRFLSPGDLNGDDMVDMIGVNASGQLNLYPSDGRGTWLNSGFPILIGTGWNGFTAIF